MTEFLGAFNGLHGYLIKRLFALKFQSSTFIIFCNSFQLHATTEKGDFN